MTSLPVTAGVSNLIPGAQAGSRVYDRNTDNNFSDFIKNDNQKEDDVKVDKKSNVRVENHQDRVKTKEAVVKNAEAKGTGKDVSKQADDMAEKVAEELGITVEMLKTILSDNGMNKMDLLSEEGLKDALLLATGKDQMALITDDGLFTNLKNLTEALDEVMEEFSKESGMEIGEVKNLFEEAIASADNKAEAGDALQNVDAAAKKQDTKDENGSEASLMGNANNMEVEAVNVPEAEKVEMTSYMDTDTERIMNQITEQIKITAKEGVTEMEMQLHPASLGNVHVHLSSKEGVLTAQFTAQNDVVKEVLQSQIVELQENFKEQGITVEAIEVMVSSQRFDQSYDEARGEEKEAEREAIMAKGRIRRFNLSELTEEEALTEEETLAKEMMEANGNTVDYLA